jgi:hypothetical protein
MSSSIASISAAPRKFTSTLVYYYMPNCPYCREFAPVYLELHDICKKIGLCTLVAIDITKHRNPGVSIKTVPTVMFFDSQGSPHKMEASSSEDRTLEKLGIFLIEQYELDAETNY